MNKTSSITASAMVLVAAFAAAGTWVWMRSHTPKAMARELLRERLPSLASSRIEELQHFPGTNAVCGEIQQRAANGQFARVGGFIVLNDTEVVLDPTLVGLIGRREQGVTLVSQPSGFAALVATQCSNS